ncbi:uncharacterized protein LOC143262243 [Megalopta genalis]|uniref:uncharacterized protein LOC143262243 n=1 Tax=Megalopta genalis TaxID=115081 RepID=UPI003FD0A76D
MALKRLTSLERKLQRDPELEKQYKANFNEYLDLGHMSEVPDTNEGHYHPHHGVIKTSSQTTKLRIALDGSAATTTGFSLNDILHTGPKIQDDLICILLRFRTHQYVITGDIEKMYRQFLVCPEDRQYQQILWRDFYIDDLLTGASTIQDALSIRNDITQLLKSAGLNVRQWASNSKNLLTGLPEENIHKKLHLEPVIIIAKILLQKLWTLKIDWDESLPMNIHTEWTQYYTQLPLLNNPNPRLHLLKSQSIPRLELCEALLFTSLVTTIQKALQIPFDRTTFWTDSTIVLHWLNSSSHTLKAFVANRVSEIQTNTTITDWCHVNSSDNPADLISRGQTIEEFLQPLIWHSGPDWLQREQSDWPSWELPQYTGDQEQRIATCMSTTSTPVKSRILERYSSWEKLVRIIARCLLWKPGQITKGALTITELSHSKLVIIKLLQGTHCQEEMRLNHLQKVDKVTNKLAKLNPFIDQDGILRVGGRLRDSNLPFSQKHPINLPKSHTATCIIMNEHLNLLHAGTQHGPDGIVRTVTVKTATSIFDRSVKQLVPLLQQSDDATHEDHPPAINNIKSADTTLTQC